MHIFLSIEVNRLSCMWKVGNESIGRVTPKTVKMGSCEFHCNINING